VTTVLSVASRAVLSACERLGLDGEAILVAAGADRDLIDDPDALIPAEVADAIWSQAVTRAADPFLALHAAEALPFGAYKVLDFLVANAPTIGAGLERVLRYFDIVDPRAGFQIIDGDPVVLRFSTALGPPPPAAQDYTFAALVLRSRQSSAAPWPLARVCFTFAPPDDLSVYERIFDCALCFGASEAELAISRAAWDQPSSGANEALFGVLDDHAQRLHAELPAAEPDLADRVRDALRDELCGGEVTAAGIGRKMGMSDRTMQRRLKALGRPFADILADVRQEIARGYLRQPDVALAEIAWLLGFSDQSTFSRAFKRREGVSPGAWRKAQRG